MRHTTEALQSISCAELAAVTGGCKKKVNKTNINYAPTTYAPQQVSAPEEEPSAEVIVQRGGTITEGGAAPGGGAGAPPNLGAGAPADFV